MTVPTPTRADPPLRGPLRTAALTLLGVLAGGLLVFALLERPFGGSRLLLAAPDETVGLLEASMEDQRRLAALDPEGAAHYRGRFDEIHTLLARMRILEHNRDRLEVRYRSLLWVLMAAGFLAVGGVLALRRGRDALRLEAVDGERRAAQGNLAAWQEAARRHSHELRTPLTAARLELDRLRRRHRVLVEAEGADEALTAIDHEIERLGRFAHRFATFARLPEPEPAEHDLYALVEGFAATFADGWPGVDLALAPPPAAPIRARVDGDLLRQVLVNLCDNAAQAMDASGGRVELAVAVRERHAAVTVADDGPGVPPRIAGRLFEPYVSGRPAGSGLGLAISRKILLDHGGDLELVADASTGATFRLLVPRAQGTG